jgi:tripartite ATP-independent transporter DctM subunit
MRWMYWIGGGILFLFVLFMFADVLLRYLFDKPLPASIDISTIVLEVTGFFGVAYVQSKKGHLVIDIITSRLKKVNAVALSTAMYIICLGVCGVLVWQGILNTISFYEVGRMSYTGMVLWPTAAVVPLGCFFLFFIFMKDVFSQMAEVIKLGIGAVKFSLMVILPIAWIVFLAFWMQPTWPGIDLLIVGTFTILLTIVFSFLGIPLAFSLFMFAIVLMGYVGTAQAGWMAAGRIVLQHATNYTFIVIPLYVIMSTFIVVTGVGADAYLAAYKWIGHWRGGLAHASVIACTGLGAVQGSPTAAIVTLGPLAVPEMRKYKYNEGLAAGVIAAGSILGPIIPPSLGAVMFGILAEASIGKLFIAGIVPGVILAVLYISQIYIQCRINPKIAPAGERSSWNERLKVLPVFGPIVLLFVIIIGGIYGGIFSAMEGGGIGAFVALIFAIAMRRLNWKNFKDAIADSMRFVCMMFLVIVGGLVYGNAMGASGLSAVLIDFLLGIGVTPISFISVVLIVYIIWGIICDAPIIIILTVPVLAPIAEAMGIDLIWFGTLTTITVGLGSLTPPYAMGIFMLRAVAMPDVPLSVLFKGILPFCLTTALIIVLIVIFPDLALWLPNMMM